MVRVNMIAIECLRASGVGSACRNLTEGLRTLGVEVVRNRISSSGIDVVDVHVSSDPMSFLLLLKHKSSGKPIVMHAHTAWGDIASTFNFSEKLESFMQFYLKNHYRQADIIIAPTAFAREMLLSELGLFDKPIEVISNGVDTKKFAFDPARRSAFRKRFGIARDKIVVYGVGNRVARKGIATFAKMAALFEDCEFFWAGSGYPKALVNLGETRDFSGENLHFPGYLEDARDIHCGGDILLFPSLYETEGIVPLEGASCGRPLVLRDIQAYEGRFGRGCFKCGNDGEFGSALERLVASRKLRRLMGRAARQSVLRFDTAKIAKMTLSVYGRAAKGVADLPNSRHRISKYSLG